MPETARFPAERKTLSIQSTLCVSVFGMKLKIRILDCLQLTILHYFMQKGLLNTACIENTKEHADLNKILY